MALTHDEFNLLKQLTELDGISGRETFVRNFLERTYKNLGYEVLYDNIGSIIAFKKSKKPNAKRVLVDAHMDEVGFLVGSKINDNTYSLIHIGYIDPLTISDAEVNIYQNGEKIKGIVSLSLDKLILRVDGNYNLIPGSMVTFVREFSEIEEDRYIAKAYDDRYGLALGIELLSRLKNIELDFDLYVSGSVREEVGLKGATTVANLVKPDLAIVLDCSRAANNFGHLGEGVLIRFYDPAMMSFEDLISFQIKTLTKNGVKFQYFATGGGTNAGAIHTSGCGIKTLTHCVCAKDIHTNSTIFSGQDYQQAKKGLFALIDNLNEVL